ncbi:MAG: hypothetical protein ACI85K_003812 [Hyphomicrobiaceae bacterium]|jgi:hypothetical protein
MPEPHCGARLQSDRQTKLSMPSCARDDKQVEQFVRVLARDALIDSIERPSLLGWAMVAS